MPTGYTAGLLDGKITTFPQFAKQCMRAFGATIHMRDENMDMEYEPRMPSKYHDEEIKKAKKLLRDANSLSDKDVVEIRRKELDESKKHHENSIRIGKEQEQTLSRMLEKVSEWEPPTTEHTGVKEFMVDQIQKTIDFDCKGRYHHKELEQIELELQNLEAKTVRQSMVDKANKDLQYHLKEQAAEIKRCSDSNQWVETFINSL